MTTLEHKYLLFYLNRIETRINLIKAWGTSNGKVVQKKILLDSLMRIKETSDKIEDILQPN